VELKGLLAPPMVIRHASAVYQPCLPRQVYPSLTATLTTHLDAKYIDNHVTHTQTDVRLEAAAASDAVRIEAEKVAQAIAGVPDATKAIDLNKVRESKWF
jgi:uncharacterized protein (DUF305 family)